MRVIRRIGQVIGCATLIVFPGEPQLSAANTVMSACNPADSVNCLCIFIGCGPGGGRLCATVELPGEDSEDLPILCADWKPA